MRDLVMTMVVATLCAALLQLVTAWTRPVPPAAGPHVTTHAPPPSPDAAHPAA